MPANVPVNMPADPTTDLPADITAKLTDAERKLLAQVRELARGPFRERAPEADAAGEFCQANADALRELGVPGMMLPESSGGLGVSGATAVRMMEEIAWGDPSTAVAVNMHLVVTGLLGLFPPFERRNAVLKAVAEEGAWCCAPGSIPLRQLDNRRAGYDAVEEGAELVWNGRSGFASMSDGARFALLGARIERGEDRDPDMVVAVADLDAEGLTNHRNWDGMGLRATASHDISLENLRMPRSDALIVPLALLRAAEQMQTQQQWQRRAYVALGILAIWLGNAQALFDEVVAYVQKRYGYLAFEGEIGAPTGLRSEQPWAQMALGNMEHWLGTSRSLLYDALRQVEEPFPDRQSFVRYQVRTTYHLRRMAEEVAQGAISVAGAHGYVRGSEIDRLYRDLTGGIVMAWKTDELRHSLGLSALGQEITIVGPAGT